ncbi:uncharacterized protein TrAtP1_008523 [Trichoderma atroviride]|uniref:uncharacterized protein n=1 Tax=Hypocrea atroviridis TaxID=63577 RepID=UPI003332A579|nr:hypothetical protein TrAtP1_008523 [Trichoderma atroviride]
MSSVTFRPSATLEPEDHHTTELSSPPPIESPSDGYGSSPPSNETIRSILRAPSPSNQYPLSRQVQNLERREREAQRKCSRLEEKCRELSLALERMTKERDEDKTSLEQRCQLAEAKSISVEAELKKQYDLCVANYEASEAEQKLAMSNLNSQFDRERKKVEQLCEKNLTLQNENVNLTIELAAMSDKYASSEMMLEEKTHESHLYRCAYSTVFKCSISVKEKCTIRDVLVRVIGRMRDEKRRQRERRANQDQNEDDEAQTEHSAQESSLFVSSSVDAAVEVEDSSLGLSNPSSRRKRPVKNLVEDEVSGEILEDTSLLELRRKRAAEAEDSSLGLSSPSSRRKRILKNQDEDQSSGEDSEDIPLLELRRKRAKKFDHDIEIL